MSRETMHPDEFEDLLGAFALDACDADETARIEAYLETRPDARLEVDRLRAAAAFLTASDVVATPLSLRDSILETARTPATTGARFAAEVARFADYVAGCTDEQLALPTENGLTGRELILHLTATDSFLAAQLDSPTLSGVDEDRLEARTHRVIEQFAAAPIAEVIEQWRAAAAPVATADRDRGSATTLSWWGTPLAIETVLLSRTFETWTHHDDLRKALGDAPVSPPASTMHALADFSVDLVPLAISAAPVEVDGRSARIVLTGDGGGEWITALVPGQPAGEPTVTVTAPVVEWCWRVADRCAADAVGAQIEGDEVIGRAILDTLPAFATL